MGYSKYTEDIGDRFVEDTLAREESFYRQWALEHIDAPPPPAGEVRLEVEGKLLEDEEVFPTGNSIKMRAVASNGAAPVEVAIVRGGTRSTLLPDALGCYTISKPKAETIEIDAASGPYHRFYAVHFVEVASIDRIGGLVEEINRFASNPPGWTREEFDAFRVRLKRVLAQNAVPQVFADGLVEYFLSVQIEAQGNPLFRDRLEAAYVILRRFAQFSDIAALVTEYFRYRTNMFGKITVARKGRQPLATITAFFNGDSSQGGKSDGATRGVEIVVPEMEYCCLEAVRAMLRDDSAGALGQVLVSRKLQGRPQDPQREERLTLIEARAHAGMGNSEKARSLYQNLLSSTCPSFQSEAAAYLRQ